MSLPLVQWLLRASILWVCAASAIGASAAEKSGSPNYEEPALLTGSIYQKGPEPRRLLFKFRRSATQVGSTVRVLREYNSPDGSTAARERVVYEDGRLVSSELEELQTGAKGSVVLNMDPRNPQRRELLFEYTPRIGAKTVTSSEPAEKDVLINDMIPFYLLSHWEALMAGSTIKFRYVVFQRAETVGFKLVKESESIWHGKPVVLLKMQPTSLVIARLVDPVHFTVEKEGEHRVLRYIGRTTPMIKRGPKWEDLDAVNMFDWK